MDENFTEQLAETSESYALPSNEEKKELNDDQPEDEREEDSKEEVLTQISQEIDQAKSSIVQTQESLANARAALGLSPNSEVPPSVVQDQETIAKLETERQKILQNPKNAPAQEVTEKGIVKELEQESKNSLPSEEILAPENQQEAIEKALGEFDGLIEDYKALKTADENYLAETRQDLQRYAQRYLESYPNEIGSRQVNQLAGEFSASVKARLNSLQQESDQTGLNSENDRFQIQRLLGEAARSTDKQETQNKLDEALSYFTKSEILVRDSREIMKPLRKRISQIAEENEEQSTRLKRRTEQEANRDLDNSLLGEQARDSRVLNQSFQERGRLLSSRDEQLIANNEARRKNFQKYAAELLLKRF